MARREWLTAEEIERSNNAPAYEHVTPEQLFGKTSDANLAARVLAKNPRRYRELRREWQYQLGERKRPVSHYDGERISNGN